MDLSNTPKLDENATEVKRERNRESMFLLAGVRFNEGSAMLNARVRNLSAGGMMIDSSVEYSKGHVVFVDLKNIGVVSGYVAWSTTTRLGIAFDNQIDPKLARLPLITSAPIPEYARPVPGRRPGLAIR